MESQSPNSSAPSEKGRAGQNGIYSGDQSSMAPYNVRGGQSVEGLLGVYRKGKSRTERHNPHSGETCKDD